MSDQPKPEPLSAEEEAYIRERCGRTTLATIEGYRSWLLGALATIESQRAEVCS